MTTSAFKTQVVLNLSALRKVFSLLRPWEKKLAGICVLLVAVSCYWNWHIFYLAHSVVVPASGGSTVEGMVGQPQFINPVLATTPVDLSLTHVVFSGLYRYNQQGQIAPDLADAMPEVGTDSKHYTVRLKPNLTWHDGRPLTARDIVFTIATIQNENLQSPLRSLWLATSVQAQDDLTAVFVTKDISGPFIHNLTVPLLPEHAWKNVADGNFSTHPLNMEPLGSGPFAIRKIEKDPAGNTRRMYLASFAGHPRRPQLEGITLLFYDSLPDMEQGYESQEIKNAGIALNDIFPEPAPETAHIQRAVLPQYQAVFLNTQSSALSDERVRRALSLALDTTAITKAAWGQHAVPMSKPPLGLTNTPAEIAEQDLGAAENLLEAAGWKRQSNGLRVNGSVSLEVSLVTSNLPSFLTAAGLIAESWKTLGATVQLNAVAPGSLIDDYVRPRRYDALLFSQRMGADPDPFAFWHSSQTKDPGLNVSNFSGAIIDGLITSARTSTDQAEREALYSQLQTALGAAVPAIYLNQSLYTYILDKHLRGAEVTALADPTWRLSHSPSWYIRTTRTWK